MIAVVLAFAAGAALLLVEAARPQLRYRPPPARPATRWFWRVLAAANLFAGIVLAPLAAFLFTVDLGGGSRLADRAAWQSSFSQVAVVPLLVVGLFGVASLAYLFGWRWARNGYLLHLRVLYPALLLFALVWLATTAPALTTALVAGWVGLPLAGLAAWLRWQARVA